MTDKETIKALECCITTNRKYKCADCPYKKTLGFCIDKLNKDVIDLINRQQAEIERLRERNNTLTTENLNLRDIEKTYINLCVALTEPDKYINTLISAMAKVLREIRK